MRFPTYPPDILSRADALLSEKYPDGIVDPRFVEIACEAMMAERDAIELRVKGLALSVVSTEYEQGWNHALGAIVAKAIRGTE